MEFRRVLVRSKARAMWGTERARIQNMVTGVSEGFKKELEINGVGYRAAVQGSALNLQLGFSHDVAYPIPEGISIKCEKPTSITITDADRQQVGQVAAALRSYRPPERSAEHTSELQSLSRISYAVFCLT